MRKIVNFLLTLLLVCCAYFGYSQVNLKIGYTPTYGGFSQINEILSSYQPANADLQEPFSDLHFIHGIQVGARYILGNSAIELSWENLSRDRSSLAFNDVTETFLDRQYRFSLNTFQLGFDSFFGSYGFGSSISNTNLAIRREIGDNELSLIAERNWGARIHFNWLIQESSTVSLVIQPFYQFYFDSYDLAPLATDLDVSGVSTDGQPHYFGITIAFYNGAQRR